MPKSSSSFQKRGHSDETARKTVASPASFQVDLPTPKAAENRPRKSLNYVRRQPEGDARTSGDKEPVRRS